MKKYPIILIALLLLTSCGRVPAKIITGKVIKVHDGDTITVLEGRAQHKIRLDGIDCPELGQAYGRRAREFTSTLVYGNQVKVIYSERDRYDRVLGMVYTMGGANLNHELVRAGLAWHYKYYSQDKKLAALEKAARKANRGLWKDKSPVPPWQFRQRK
jgi:endonuclease YncB( thermonuclease family)